MVIHQQPIQIIIYLFLKSQNKKKKDEILSNWFLLFVSNLMIIIIIISFLVREKTKYIKYETCVTLRMRVCKSREIKSHRQIILKCQAVERQSNSTSVS